MFKTTKYILSICILSLFIACEENFDDYNTPKNQRSTLDVEFEIPTITQSLEPSWGFLTMVASEYAHQHAWKNFEVMQYIYHSRNDNLWSYAYSKLATIEDVISRTGEGGDTEFAPYNAIGKICKVFHMAQVTDSYGDVPYFEAGKAIRKPVYDKQEDIYKDLFKLLDEAMISLEGWDKLDWGDRDRVFAGDLPKWRKFANSIRLRLAMHIRFVNTTMAQSELSKAMATALIDNNDESATIWNSPDNAGLRNPAALWEESNSTLRLSNVFVDFLKANSDPRLSLLAAKDASDDYSGMPNGMRDPDETQYSKFGPAAIKWELVDRVMMYSEVAFLKAEAYLAGAGVSKDDAKANEEYRNGIKASMSFWGVDENDINTYLAGAKGNLQGTDDDKLKMIAEQKWVALFNTGLEVYNEIRRLNYPVIQQRTDQSIFYLGDTNGFMPRRCKYPEDERRNNTTNYNKAVSETNDNSFMHKVWWDVN